MTINSHREKNKNPTWQTGKSLSCTIQYPNCTSDKVLVSEYRLPFWRKKSSENNRIFGSDSFRLSYNLSLCHEPLGPVLSHLLISANHFCDYAALHAKIFPLDPIMNSRCQIQQMSKYLTSVICESPVSISSPIQDILLANMSMIPGKTCSSNIMRCVTDDGVN